MKIVAKVLLIDKDKDFLVLRRNYTHPNFPHHYDFPGGEVEENENSIQAAQREIAEETGIEISLDSIYLGTEKKIDEHLIHVVYVGKLNESKPNVSLSWEHGSYEWLSADQLKNEPYPDNVDNYYITAINFLRANSIF